ncbi:glycosyl hydrolase [Flavobacterium sp. RHBU_24]|uniref:glycosyl hydrolase n=1 Tax=Flavobacterium sp. RHBU_24 TaxID=3391185 RepID=UPI0039854075
MKHFYVLASLLAFGLTAQGQTPVSVGSGSYASAPPDSENVDWNSDGVGDIFPFIFDNPIYVQEGETRPIPTNDWWTDLLVSKYSGLLWSYPMMVDTENYGAKVFFPNSFVPDGSNVAYGGGVMIKANGYNPVKSVAKDWNDWGVVVGMPDATGEKNMDITLVHGVPFTWFETQGISPKLSFDNGATFVYADGSPATFPITQSFVIQTDGRHFGVHLAPGASLNLEGQQYLTIDLQSVQPITKVKLNWEAAYASGYALQVSDNGTTWNTVFTETNGNGGIDDIPLTTSGRYVKILLNQEGTQWSYSLYEMEVFNGTTLLSQGKPVEVSSTQAAFVKENVNDGNTGTRWAADGNMETAVVMTMPTANSYFVMSALPNAAALTTYEQYAFNKVTDTDVTYDYQAANGKVVVNWNLTTSNLKGLAAGSTIQGFLPHLYANAENNINFTANNYVTARGQLKTAVGNSYTFSYKFGGVLPSFNSPYSNSADAHPYDADVMFNLLTTASAQQNYGGDTYWGGKDLVNFAKYTLMAKEMGHQAYPALKEKTRNALANWLTYTPGEDEKFFARYDRWKAIVGFNESFGSAAFTDNHFHYGYLIQACAMYAMVDHDFLVQYGDMIKLVARQYANWIKDDTFLPYMRTFDPWIGHSYAGGTSSGNGNNQESTSEAMQSWTGLFLLGDVLGDQEILDAAAFGYMSESYATLEYWFDWRNVNLPPAYPHNMVGILSNQGFAYGTYFSANPLHIHGIQYLPVNPGFKYLARDTDWALGEYTDMMEETQATEGFTTETQFGDDWAHVALGFRLLFDPEYVSAYLEQNMTLPANDPNYIMDYNVAGMTYYYTHAIQNLGDFSNTYYTDFPSSSVFEENGTFSHAVAYNSTAAAKTCTIYNADGTVYATFPVPAYTLVTYPQLPTEGQVPQECYNLLPVASTASTGNAMQAIDGNPGSRWESAFADPQWIQVDMGEVSTVSRITISWEAANAKDYTLKGSIDGTEWVTIGTYTNMAEGNRVDLIENVNANYRYLRIDGTARNLVYGYSIFEIQVCGATALGVTAPAALKNISVYPNPAHGYVNIKTIEDTEATLYNINGAQVLKQTLRAGETTLKLNSLQSGLYLLKVGDQVTKLLIQ